MNKAAFLDRDGTLVRAFNDAGVVRGPRTQHEVELLPGVQLACHELDKRGYRLVMVTNQPDVSRGLVARHTADWVNQSIATTLGFHAWRACYHDNHDHCCCRKPKPGLLYYFAVQMGLCLEECVMFGDTIKDRYAALAAGIPFIQIETNGSILEAMSCL